MPLYLSIDVNASFTDLSRVSHYLGTLVKLEKLRLCGDSRLMLQLLNECGPRLNHLVIRVADLTFLPEESFFLSTLTNLKGI